MMRIIPFEASHLENLLLQPSQAMLQPMLKERGYGDGLEKAGPSYSGVVGDQVLACMGLLPQWQERAIAWGLIAAEAGPYFKTITRAVFRTMELHPFRRIEASVKTDFEAGHRWARLLGFQREGTMRAYTTDGDDYDLYARIR
jgi:hypothetical protein